MKLYHFYCYPPYEHIHVVASSEEGAREKVEEAILTGAGCCIHLEVFRIDYECTEYNLDEVLFSDNS